MSEIKFFGEVDIHPVKKVIMSEMPAWTLRRQFDLLGEDVAKMERQLEKDQIPKEHIAEHKELLKQKKEKFEQISASIPKVSDPDKDKISRIRKEMGKIIQAGYYKRSDMIKGTVDAHSEAERMTRPKIDVKPEFAEFVQAANVPITGGKITRDGMVKTWKIMGHLLNHYGGDEDTNAETLRRD